MSPGRSCPNGQEGSTHPCHTSTATTDTSYSKTTTTTNTSETSSTSNAGSSATIQTQTSTVDVPSATPTPSQTTVSSSTSHPDSGSPSPPTSTPSIPTKPSLDSTSATGNVPSGSSSPSTNSLGLYAPTSVIPTTHIVVLPTLAGWYTVTVTTGTVATTVDGQTVFVDQSSASTPASRGNEHRDTTLGLAIGIPLLLLLVAGAMSVFFVRRRRRRELNGAPSRPFTFAPIRSADSRYEVLPAYSPPLLDKKEYLPFPEKPGVEPLPTYGYTAHEPQVEWESEQEGTSGEGASGRLMHAVHADSRGALVPLRRSE